MKKQITALIVVGMLAAALPAVAGGDGAQEIQDEQLPDEATPVSVQEYLSNPFVSDVLGSEELKQIRANHDGDEGLIAVVPVATEDPHVALIYQEAAPGDVEQALEASDGEEAGLPIEIHENVEPSKLIEQAPGEPVDPTGLVAPRSGHLAAENTGIGPGQDLLIDIPGEGSFGCTSNFVYEAKGTYYLGTAGHCVLPTGCDESKDPCFSQPTVRICVSLCVGSAISTVGFYETLGDVLYARQAQGGVQIGQDYAFVEIPTSLNSQIRSTMPTWGGPTGELAANDEPSLEPIFHYGQGIGLADTVVLERRAALALGNGGEPGSYWAAGWATGGDSGSGAVDMFVDASEQSVGGDAVGDITHSIVGVGAPLFFGTMSAQGVAFTKAETGTQLSLVTP